ncbi:MAG TPA: hypothetical protein VGB79_03170 [Allosphingosinicella sp.]|jgi:hypothetical protein
MSEKAPGTAALGCATVAAIFVPLPLVAILLSLGAGPEPGLFALVIVFGAPIAAAHVLPLFLPFYLMLAALTPVRWWGAATLGLACGGIPALLLSGADPVTTSLFAGSGFVGGIAFWLTVMRATR